MTVTLYKWTVDTALKQVDNQIDLFVYNFFKQTHALVGAEMNM